MTRDSVEWELEREEWRTRLELAEARAKRTEDQLAALAAKVDSSSGERAHGDDGESNGSGGRMLGDHVERDRWRKLEIPIFSGDDAYGWTHRLERYFELRSVPEAEKLRATLVAMEGRALSWYHWWARCNPEPTWEGFKMVVIRRFQPSMVQNPFELLLALKQTRTVVEFVEEFEKYVGALKSIDEDFARGIFMNGLKEEIQVEVKLYELKSLSDLIQKSIMIEEKNMVWTKKGTNAFNKPYNQSKSNSYTRTVTVEAKPWLEKTNGAGHAATPLVSAQVGEVNKIRGGEFKRLTGAGMREKREKGLCFRCDEPYHREHKCKNKQFRMIILEEDDVLDSDTESQEVENFSSLQLSLCSTAGLTSTKSWKMQGQVQNKAVLVLIDCGASHSFISQDMVQKLELVVENTPSYIVEVGDGHKVKCKGKCSKLSLQLQGMEIEQDFYLFTLQGVDLVLGLDWLSGLGEVKANFGKLELTLSRDGKRITLVGDPALTKTELSYGAFMQILKEEGEGLLIQYDTDEQKTTENSVIPEAVSEILQQYLGVFEDPQDLPPHRRLDHAIHLKEGAEIPNLRPYKYPHYQKTKIERLVSDMLEAGIIRPSISPYSSPIILIKKKDEGWRFCVDYRALNKITIPNKFPIPIIEELLDELDGPNIFTKLDLKDLIHRSESKWRTDVGGNMEVLVKWVNLPPCDNSWERASKMLELLRGAVEHMLNNISLQLVNIVL
ncbi:hypothetical protein OROGR_030396 [Orobanche gracilis]